MFVLRRKLGEIVHIGSARVHVTAVKNGAVELAIEAPPEVLIARDEVRGLKGAARTPVVPAREVVHEA